MLLLAPLVIANVWSGLMDRSAVAASESLQSLITIAMLLVVSLPVVLIVVSGAKPYQMGLHAGHWGRNIVLGACSFLLATPLVLLTFHCALQFFPSTPHAIELKLREDPSLANYALEGLGAVAIGPFLEELWFRGILQPWLIRVLGAWPGIGLSSAVFAISHIDAWPAPIPLFVLALFLGYLAYRTTSLIAAVSLHSMFNALNMLLLLRGLGEN
jgi:hypothetical protein